MDNLSVHTSLTVIQALLAARARFLDLLAYEPDLSLIELAF
ncbi:transposase [Methylobacterium segetis]|nr:transposase [Methylobacterium segetis]